MKKLLPLLIILLLSSPLLAQDSFNVKGIIRDARSNENLFGVNVLFPELGIGGVTNEYGFYSIKVPAGKHQLLVSFLGYTPISREIVVEADLSLDFRLEETTESLEEVIITENQGRINISKPEMSVNTLELATVRKLPVIFGEVDILKSLLLLPGVSNAGEGSSGFNVRGGAADQNLVLLDEATVYNASHLFGLVSVFNPDAIKNLKLYKGGIPANYGGRVSSVLDIYQKDGNSREFEAQGGIGVISSRLLAEGPILKDKASFLIGGRSSYAHLFLKLSDNPNSAYFYDLNTKLNFQLDERNRLLFSGYLGRDVFNINESFNNKYGNTVFNLRWNHLLNDQIFTNLSVIYSDYYYGLTLDFVGFDWNSGIRNLNVKYDFDHFLTDDLTLDYGLQSTYYAFNPGEIQPNSENSGINTRDLTKKYAFEGSIYLSVEHAISRNFNAEYGVRYSTFSRLGQELNQYQDDKPIRFNEDLQIYEEADPIGTTSLSRSKVERFFGNFEPRLSLAYTINEDQSVKASYNRMTQYLHLITNTSSPTPLDVWAPSGKYLEPQSLDQVALGYYRNFSEDRYSVEVEGFYKDITNRLDYIAGANLIANNAIEQVVLSGKAKAYGADFLLRKNLGKLTGWLAYTLSRSEQRTPGRTPAESGINNGEWYATAYDKTHDLALVATYEINEKWSLGSNFIFQTGLPTTYPSGMYQFEDLTVPVYASRNSNRLPAYHRLDISATYTPKLERKGYSSSWNFGIYNVYNRKNAVSLNFRRNEDTGSNEAVRLSLFGIIPSVTYNFKF